MRILHIYSGNLYGGVETLLLALARNRDVDGSIAQSFCLCFDGRLRQELAPCADTYLLNQVRLSKPWTVLSARRRLRQILKGHPFDVAICHSPWCQAIFGPIVRQSGLPLVFALHDSTNGTHWLERLARRVSPDLVIANSSFTIPTANRFYPSVRTEVMYWPVTAPVSSTVSDKLQTRAQLGAGESDVVIIQVSRLEPWKGHTLHLEALSHLRDKRGWLCWMVGGPQRNHEHEYLASLERQARAFGISDRVKFLGQRSDVDSLLAAANIHCQPNLGAEPFGRTFIEALYSGLPVVTTKIGAAIEIVENSCGILVAPNNAAELAKALESLIVDSRWRGELAQRAPARAQLLCDPKRQIHRLSNLLLPIIRQSEPIQA